MKTASLAHLHSTAATARVSEMFFSRSRERKAIRMGFTRGTAPRKAHGKTHAWLSAVLSLMLLALLSGCSSDSGKPAETAKPEVKGPEMITARSAFQKLYIAARGWNPDAKPYRLEATVTSDGNGQDGKWAVWRASFASATQRSAKSYTWSGSAADGAPPRGVNPGTEDSYSATNSSTQVFDMAFLKIDSDQAFATAQKHGGDKILEKEPTTPVFYVCDWNHNTNQLVWHVIYGTSRDGAKLTVAVDATSGEFIRIEK
jgi:hypothetical protein